MSKELENLKKLMSFAFVMSENMVGLSKGNYDEKEFIKKTYEYLHKYNVDLESRRELEKALQRLEAIDNANPSEAMKCLHTIAFNTEFIAGMNFGNELTTIEQALLEAQDLEKENAKYKNTLKNIKEKGLYNSNLNFVAICDSYNVYKRRMTEKWDTEIPWNNKEALDLLKLLTREEFDSIKEMLK